MAMLQDVRDPHKWRKFIGQMRERAAAMSSNARSSLYLQMDLGIAGPSLVKEQRMHAAIYRLCRHALTMDGEYNRKEIVNLYNVLIHGPVGLKSEVLKIVEKWHERD